MTEPTKTHSSKMEKIVALCKRRGFIFQSSEIYGGINGFWDYGPLGVELKRNLKEAWWQDMVKNPSFEEQNLLIDIVGLDSSIIMNPKAWVASGHVGGFNDPMVDCRETKNRYRADHLVGALLTIYKKEATLNVGFIMLLEGEELEKRWLQKAQKIAKNLEGKLVSEAPQFISYSKLSSDEQQQTIGPDTETVGTLTKPRQFNLMFKTSVGALEDPAAIAYLRPETAQGIFANFRNVLDTTRVKLPFGIAQIGKAFRNEVTPRNFIFRSREFEQMELEFFVPPLDAKKWYDYFCKTRYNWWLSLGISKENLQLRAQTQQELAHYAKEGAGSSDIEYRFPFTYPNFGELEGIAHRSDYDLKQHAEHAQQKDKFKYYDQEKNERYYPHIIEPSAGADRGVLALLCEAYTEDENRPSKLFMRFHPRIAPIKAAIFPLVDRDGMGEIAKKLYLSLRKRWNVQLDIKQNIGKRYARMDEAGTPFCFTIDSETLVNQTVTVRDRDTLEQKRIAIHEVEAFLAEKLQ